MEKESVLVMMEELLSGISIDDLETDAAEGIYTGPVDRWKYLLELGLGHANQAGVTASLTSASIDQVMNSE